jgi:hypothetical protein
MAAEEESAIVDADAVPCLEGRDNLPLAINAVCITKRYEICILTTQWPVDPITEPADDCPIAKV